MFNFALLTHDFEEEEEELKLISYMKQSINVIIKVVVDVLIIVDGDRNEACGRTRMTTWKWEARVDVIGMGFLQFFFSS